MEHAPVTDRDTTADETASACPFPHAIASALPGCPVPHGATTTRVPVERSAADRFVRRLLRIQERPEHISEAQANATFQKSMVISGTRCTLTYVIFPIVLPLLSIAKDVGLAIGVVIGTFAIVCDVFTIRRFFAADHRYRWHFSAIALGIITLLFVLLAEDVIGLVA
jgi:hypothetical protein